jgi:hypothetical protein
MPVLPMRMRYQHLKEAETRVVIEKCYACDEGSFGDALVANYLGP